MTFAACKKAGRLRLVAGLLAFFVSFTAEATVDAVVERVTGSGKPTIPGLSWASDRPGAEVIKTEGGAGARAGDPAMAGKPAAPGATPAPAAAPGGGQNATLPENIKVSVTLKGTLDRPAGTSMLYDNKVVAVATDKTFAIKVDLQKQINAIVISVVGPDGKIDTEEVQLYIRNFDDIIRAEVRGELPFHFIAGLGYQVLTYKQDLVPLISVTKISTRLGSEFTMIYPTLTGSVDAILDMANLSSEPEYLKISFFRGDAKVSWHTGIMSAPWKLSFHFGGIATKMTATPPVFGFDMVAGIQAYPELAYRFSESNAVSAHVRYSPLLTGEKGGSEMRTGGTYTHFFGNGMRLSADFDHQTLVIEDGNIQSKVTYFGVSTYF